MTAKVSQPALHKPTTWRDRFTEAVAHLCGAEPPEEYVNEWLANIDVNGEHRLQSWVGAQRIPSWAQCIVILDAARVLADTPEEGMGHLDEDGN